MVDAAFRRARTGMAVTDASGNFLEVNEALATFFGYPAAQLTTMSFRDLTLAQDLAESAAAMKALSEGTSSEFTLDKRYVTSKGNVVWGRLTGIAVRDSAGDLVRVIAQIEDLSERMAVSEALGRSESEDELTGLTNRRVFYERLREALEDPRRSARQLALLVVNLNRFHQINAGLGEPAADLILREVARRLLAGARGRDTVARFAGDEFAVLAPDITSPEDAIALAVAVRHSLGDAYWADGNPIVVSARVGVVTAPADGEDSETLIRRAMSASNRAKSLSSGWATHADGIDQASHDELSLVADLRDAIGSGGITVAFQPIVDSEGHTYCVEALARWYHPERGAVPPDQFIVLAEQNDLIEALTKRVLTVAVEQAAQWQSMQVPVSVAVNLSGSLLGHPDLVEEVAGIARAAGLAPGCITLEITETAIADSSSSETVAALEALRRTGVRISIDDFGTGYSSLAYLKQLPVDELKIDRSFIIDLNSDPRTGRIVRSIIDLAHSLELTVVAEGVEDEAAASSLLRLGADYLQGYFIGMPSPARATSTWLDSHSPLVARERARYDERRTMDVLVIDDHPGVRAVLRERLTQRNHRVEEARNAGEALDKLKVAVPDLVILNHPGSGLPGVEAAAQLRDAGYVGPIVLFSGSSPEDMASIRFPIDVWPVSKTDNDTLMRLIDGYAAQAR